MLIQTYEEAVALANKFRLRGLPSLTLGVEVVPVVNLADLSQEAGSEGLYPVSGIPSGWRPCFGRAFFNGDTVAGHITIASLRAATQLIVTGFRVGSPTGQIYALWGVTGADQESSWPGAAHVAFATTNCTTRTADVPVPGSASPPFTLGIVESGCYTSQFGRTYERFMLAGLSEGNTREFRFDTRYQVGVVIGPEDRFLVFMENGSIMDCHFNWLEPITTGRTLPDIWYEG